MNELVEIPIFNQVACAFSTPHVSVESQRKCSAVSFSCPQLSTRSLKVSWWQYVPKQAIAKGSALLAEEKKSPPELDAWFEPIELPFETLEMHTPGL